MRCMFLLVFLLWLTPTWSLEIEPYPEPTLSSPRDTMNFFLKTMKGHKLGDPQGLDLAVEALNRSELDPSTRVQSSRLIARRLISTLDRLEYIDIESVPEEMPEGQVEWVYRKQSVAVDRIMRPVIIAIGLDESGLWRFTPETLRTIEIFERSVRDLEVIDGVVELRDWKTDFKSKMPSWTSDRSLILLNGQWIALFILILLAFVIERVLIIFVGKATQRWLAKQEVIFDKTKQSDFTRPLGIVIFALIWNGGIQLLELPDNILSWFLRGGIIVLTLAAVKMALNIVDVLSLYFGKIAAETSNPLDDILVPLFSKSAKFFILCLGIILVGDSLTLDMKGIIAGMGIGGIAFALAAKDTVSNFFGSLTVILDRPFSIGDWVNIDGKIEGIVEEVGMRSTRIRTFYDSQITLPNGQLTNVNIDNYKRRTYNRYRTMLNVQYDTPPEKLEVFCEAVRQIIIGHQWTRKDNFHVYVNEFGPHSIDILVYMFWNVPNWAAELHERHRFIIDVLRLANSMDIRFAFPTQTLHMFQESKVDYQDIPASPEQIYGQAVDDSRSILGHPMTSTEPRSGILGGQKLDKPTVSL
jgi:MscS family membrane protein